MVCLRFIFCRFIGNQTRTPFPPNVVNVVTSPSQTQASADDLIVSQLQAIFQLFSSYLPSGEFCLVSELNIQPKKMAALRFISENM